MLSDLTPEQLALAKAMSDLSEKAYFAGWMSGLEFTLWEGVVGEGGAYGRLVLTADDVNTLRHLSAACDGWIVFDDATEETWVVRSEWEHRFFRLEESTEVGTWRH
jgi:hypothetical protein